MIERALVEAAERLRDRGEPHVIATVIRVLGSAYRRPGARMLVSHDGTWTAGCVSGGCLEEDIARRAWWRTEHGPTVVRYDSTIAPDAEPDDVREAYGLGCGGIVEILLERAAPATTLDPLAIASRCRREQQRCAVATVVRSGSSTLAVGTRAALVCGAIEVDGFPLPSTVREEIVAVLHGVLARGRSICVPLVTSRGSVDVFVEAIRPPPRLFVFGANHDVSAVVRLARMIGWDVVLCAQRARGALRESISTADEVVFGRPVEVAERIAQSDRAFAVVMNHSLDTDRECLGMLMRTRIGYIGVLGPRARTRRLLASLDASEQDQRIHSPVGLELGAETPAEIALAIVAEIQAALTHAPATHLRERAEPIHATMAPVFARPW